MVLVLLVSYVYVKLMVQKAETVMVLQIVGLEAYGVF